jgi:hypothetical protein
MAATSILSTDAEMNAMAGELVDTTGWTDANKTAWGLQAEAYLASLSRYDWSTNVATIKGVAAEMLSEYVARYCAISGIAYNMGTVGATFSSLIEPEDMIQLHIYRMEQIEKLLKDQDFVNWVKG